MTDPKPAARLGRPHAPCYWTQGLMQKLFEAVDSSGVAENIIAKRAGVARGLLGNWRTGKRAPQALLAADAMLQAIGYEIVIRRKPAARRACP